MNIICATLFSKLRCYTGTCTQLKLILTSKLLPNVFTVFLFPLKFGSKQFQNDITGVCVLIARKHKTMYVLSFVNHVEMIQKFSTVICV